MTTLRLFVAHGCHLCEPALAVARAVCGEVGADLEIVSIDGDAHLETTYRERIPLAEVDGQEVGRYVLERDLLILALARR